MTEPPTVLRVGILGATGLVGQRLISGLTNHPWMRIEVLGASERSAGRRYEDAARWALPGRLPAEIAERVVVACEPGEFARCDCVLSSLASGVAEPTEAAFRDAGFAIVTNSGAYRMHPDVPLVIPEINPDHLDILPLEGGFIVANPNCAVVGLAMVLAPLHEAFGVRRAIVSTLQAASGAGIEGPTALALVDNVIPYIAGEEDKLEAEFAKIAGRAVDGRIEPADVVVSAHCHRVPTIDGHLEAVSVELDGRPDPEAVAAALAGFESRVAGSALPSAPASPIVVRTEADRPQPRLDRDDQNGMAVVVGRVRRCAVLGTRLVLLSHNAVRGAAGAAILNAELLIARGRLHPRR